MRRTVIVAVLSALSAAAAGLVFAGPVSAHTALRKSTPAKNAEVDSLPEISLVFTEDINPKVVKVQLRDANGGQHEAGSPKVAGDTVTQPVSGGLTAGRYSIVYRVISADGHPVQGEVPFTFVGDLARPAPPQNAAGGTAPPPNPTPASAADPDDSKKSGGSKNWLVVAGVLIAVLAAGGGVYLLRARRSGR